MAAPKRILSLNLGTQSVGIAEFKADAGGGLTLLSYQLTELLADPAADASRLSQMRVAATEVVASQRVKGLPVNYAISAQSVFTRFVKLPPVDEDKVGQIITFEAQQNVPFPINEVVWTYQLVGAGDGRLEVVLVAIKSDLLDEINESVEDAGLNTDVVDVAPMALYNAFRYSYSDLSGCSLVIDIGARTTNLIFVEPRKVFSRSVPIGGTTITSAVAKEFGEQFGLAEQRKKDTGFVSLGGSYAEPDDPEVGRVSKIVRNTMTRLHGEISRSISFYRSQQQGSTPTRVFLSGGSSALPYMREFFQEKLQLPVEFFNPLRNVAVGPGLNPTDLSSKTHVLGELVGLALRSAGESPMELNLRPESVTKKRRAASRKPYVIAAGVCLMLSLAGWALYFFRAGSVEAAVLSQLEPKVANLKAFEGKFDAVKKEIKTAQDTAVPFLQAASERDYWLRVIDDINSRLPDKYIWVTLMEPAYFTADSKAESFNFETTNASAPAVAAGVKSTLGLKLRGLYLDNPKGANVIDEFLKNLTESPYFDINPDKKSEVIPIRVPPNNIDWAYDYELHLNLKKPIPFQ
jgi:type IV pilus assembly protein PilM